MANIKSSIKRAKINKVKAMVNKRKKSALKTQIKKTDLAIQSAAENADELFRKTQADLDRAATNGLISKNTAARRKSRLAKLANKAGEA
ncbi:MAG TPA: 30S ribosomal protein S20 [Clostridiaceae bacterium]|nr:30S ribosomal protein S20 [Clostridiaceae bacterium]